MSDWVDVAGVSQLGPGDRRVIDVEGAQIVVVNVGGEYFAVEDVCTHDGTPLGDGEVIDHEIVCPRHGARFCLRTGRALCAPAYEPVATFPVRVEGGVVQVRDARFD
ncbi:MAG: non-heme iron oxygenase ferredoxin subunit [Chromatiales bacterium]